MVFRVCHRNPINRNGVGDRSGLTPGADGCMDLYYIQDTSTAGHESNWLPYAMSPRTFQCWLERETGGDVFYDSAD
jgi:hypothetical protein